MYPQKKNKSLKVKLSRGKTLVIPKTCMMMRNRDYMRRLYKAATKKKSYSEVRTLLETASPQQLGALCESSKNLLRGTFPRLNKQMIRRLVPLKKILRKLACEKTSIVDKKKTLLKSMRKSSQRGGILPIATILAPILGSLLGSAVSSLI